jgi:MFS family permease
MPVQIFQGLAPSFFGGFADIAGRRPAYAGKLISSTPRRILPCAYDMTVCFAVYIVANIGLALQNSYPALFVLRCVQSTGSSATIAMCSAVVADVATAAERGKYMGAAYSGSLLGPAIGPVIGGVLAEFLGWRAIFWFLTILGAAFTLVFAIFLPETGTKPFCPHTEI